MDEKWRQKVIEKLENIDTRLAMLVTRDGNRGVMLPKCEKESIKKQARLFRWVLYFYGTLIILAISAIIKLNI